MFSNVLRDAELVDVARPTLVAPLQAYLAEAAEILTVGWPARGRRRRLLAAAVRHAIDFRPGARSRATASGDQTR